MRPMRLPSLALLLLALPLLGGCLMFERPPAPLVCDQALVGRWLPLPGTQSGGSPLGREDYVQVDAKCTATLVDDKNMKDRPSFPALGFSLDGARYLALNQTAMRQLFNDTQAPAKPSKLPPQAVMLVKYHIDNGVLEVALPDATTVTDLIGKQQLKAREIDSTYYLVEGDPAAMRKVLADHDLFGGFADADRPLRLRRASTEAAP